MTDPARAHDALAAVSERRRRDVRLGTRFWALVVARTVSVGGNAFGRVALAFAVLSIEGTDAGTVSLVLFCQAIPQLLFVLLGGAIADRMSRSRLMIVSELGATVAWTGLTFIVAVGQASVLPLCLLALLAGTSTAMFAPALAGVVPEVVPREGLQRANSALRVGQNVALLTGLGASAVVVSTLGVSAALGINAASFAISGCLIVLVKAPNPSRKKNSLLIELREGGREFFSRQWLWVVTAQFAVVMAALNATVGVLGPIVADDSYGGARAWSLLLMSQAIGTVGGAALAARIRVRHPLRVAVLSTLWFAVPMFLLSQPAPLPLVCLAMLVSGFASDVFSVLWSTTLQQRIPQEVLSRVSSYDSFGSLALAPLGLFVAGPASLQFGAGVALVVCGSLAVVATCCALLSAQVRSLTTHEVVPEA